MHRKGLLVGLVIVGLARLTLAAASPDDAVLLSGKYTAHVTAIPCEGCPAIIEKTMLGQKGIASATADQKSSSLTFQVAKGASIKPADLQKALKAASDEMGMGADYSLKNIKKLD